MRRTGRIEQTQCIRILPNHYSDGIVIENRRDIFTREFVRGVRNQKTSLAYGTVTHYNALDCLHAFFLRIGNV